MASSVLTRSAGALSLVVAAIHVSAAASVITVHVAPIPAGGCDIVIRAADDPAAAARVVSLSPAGVARVEVKPSTLIAVRARAPHFWSPEKVVSGERTDVALDLFPTGIIRGRVVGAHLPGSIGIRFEPVETKSNDAPNGDVVCPLTGEGTWTCEVPEGQFDLGLHVKGFIPIFRTAVAVAAARDVDMGDLALRQGASVAGRVRTSDGQPLTRFCQVRLLPRSASINSDKAARDEPLRSMTVSPDVRGRYQFAGVPPGSYDLVVTQPGYAEAWRRRIPVVARTEAMLSEPITIERATAAEIVVSPPSDPAGRPWTIRLFDADGSATRLDALAIGATEEGRRRFGSLAPDRYFITVSSGEETWFGEERTIVAADEVIRIDVPLKHLVGRVSLGERGLAADITLIDNPNSISISLRSDENGELAGVLPRRDAWDVKVSAPESHVMRTLKNVHVENGDDIARMTIDLPDTTVRGTVVNPDGTPHGDGYVAAQDGQSYQQAPVAADGTFSFAGFDGDVSLQATATGGRVV